MIPHSTIKNYQYNRNHQNTAHSEVSSLKQFVCIFILIGHSYLQIDIIMHIITGLFHKQRVHEKINGHRELTVSSRGPMIMAQSRLGEVTAQSRRGHSSVTARSQLSHGILSMITAQSRLGHSSITAQVTAQSRLAVTILVTVSSPWAHREQSRWPIFFLMGVYCKNASVQLQLPGTVKVQLRDWRFKTK